MPSLLCIDTATDVCSVAVSRDGELLFNREDHAGPNHAECLGPFVDEALAFADGHGVALEAVAVSGGPGSYTGLRIGVSMAKGLCYGRGLRLIGVPTLEVLCAGAVNRAGDDNAAIERGQSKLVWRLPSVSRVNAAKGTPLQDSETSVIGGRPQGYAPTMQRTDADGLLCPMVDARRMEVYAAVYDHSMTIVRAVQADIVDADTYRELLDNNKVYFFGNGAAKCMEVIAHPNAVLISDIKPLARNMTAIAERRLAAGQTDDVAYYEPFYLKEYVAKVKN